MDNTDRKLVLEPDVEKRVCLLTVSQRIRLLVVAYYYGNLQ